MNAIIKDNNFCNKLQFYKNIPIFEKFFESLNNNYHDLLDECFKNNVFSIKHLQPRINVGDYCLIEHNADKSRDESRIYFYKKKIVLKVRIVPKIGSMNYCQCIKYLNLLEKRFYNIDDDLYRIIKIREMTVSDEVSKRLQRKEIYFICTFHRGVSLEYLKENFFKSDDYSREDKVKIAKIIILRLCRLLLCLDDCYFYLCDMEIRNFGFSIDYFLSILDEEMLHVEENPKERRKILRCLLHEICQKTFSMIFFEANNFKNQMLNYLNAFWNEDKTKKEVLEYINILGKSYTGQSSKRKRRVYRNQQKKKRKISKLK